MTRAEFEEYINYFNTLNYDKLTEYFADDLEVQFNDTYDITGQYELTLHGKEGFLAFYQEMHKTITELMEVGFCLYDGTNLVVELYTEFQAKEDTTLVVDKLKKGDIVVTTNWACYDFDENGKFKKIRIAHWRCHKPETAYLVHRQEGQK